MKRNDRYAGTVAEQIQQLKNQLAAAQAKNKLLLEALEWYAHPVLPYAITQINEPRSAVHADKGLRARKALEAAGGAA